MYTLVEMGTEPGIERAQDYIIQDRNINKLHQISV